MEDGRPRREALLRRHHPRPLREDLLSLTPLQRGGKTRQMIHSSSCYKHRCTLTQTQVSKLLDAGEDANQVWIENNGITALQAASQYGHHEVDPLLLKCKLLIPTKKIGCSPPDQARGRCYESRRARPHAHALRCSVRQPLPSTHYCNL